MSRRRFNGSERTALYLAAEGKCAQCGTTLDDHWHADHVVPFSRDGLTDVTNGQALCATCNLRKGNRVSATVVRFPEDFELRGWQRDAYSKYVAKRRAEPDNRDFLMNATPGSGKTIWALYVAMQSLVLGETKKIHVVVPTAELRTSWVKEASDTFGIQLNPDGVSMSDFDGIVTTYQQVGRQPATYRTLVSKHETFVIFDEIHHAGDDRSWGSGIREAYSGARRRLAITGTPFRSDSNSIPFVRYLDGQSDPDASYSYGEAIQDKVCRELYFPSYEGDLRWWEEKFGSRTATFADELDEKAARRRLNTAIDPGSDWMRTVLVDANNQLDLVRRDIFPHAAGLVIAKDQLHAANLARLLAEISGEQPEVVTSERVDAADAIQAFKRVPPNDQLLLDVRSQPKKWIVAVKMVSEGVDIKRLFVEVYATNITTELFFRQAVGRVVRMMPGVDGQVGYVYIPAEPVLVEFAQRIKEERFHALAEQQRAERIERERQEEADRSDLSWSPEGADARADNVIFDGEAFAPHELSAARADLREAGIDPGKLNEFETVRLWRVMARKAGHAAPAAGQQARAEQPLYERKQEVRRRTLPVRVSRLVAIAGGPGREWFDHKFANGLLRMATGVSVEDATLDQLYERVDLLDHWTRMANSAWSTFVEWQWVEEARNASRSAS